MSTAKSALEITALLSSAFFAGGALIITIAEHPTRSLLDEKQALIQWSASYDKASVWQAGNAALAALSGALNTVLFGSSSAWMIGGSMVGLNIPFTLIFIMPVNKALKKKATNAMEATEGGGGAAVGEPEGEEFPNKICLGSFALSGPPTAKYLMSIWGQLHGARALLGATGLLVMVSHVVSRRVKKI